ncbi:cytochrome P450 [Microbacterium sp. No. 7]|uniref:cytochrome P450 n=1 Tax=Microbacterium sp. No. 7 TaxID=1714373 RepID=UPI0006CFA2F0|nr:cytochrome P450 [Microbacterium sp. No. 7]ALJ18878.1 hypothetical protein AOA12_02705 [Microbacterium sp. No. 7]
MSENPATTMFTSRRDLNDRFTPACELADARDRGEWPEMRFRLPQYTEDFRARGVTRVDEVRQVLGSPDFVMGLTGDRSPGSLAGQPGVLLYTNGAEHARLRRMLARSFTVRRVEALRPRIEEIVARLLDTIDTPRRQADLFAEYALQIPTQVICELLGVPYEDRAEFHAWAPVIMDLGQSRETVTATIRAVHDYVAVLVEAARRAPGDDLIGALVRDHGESLSDEELIGLAMFVFIAGHDTTSNMISLSIVALLDHPDQLAAWRDDDGLTKGAVEELLRYVSSSTSLPNRLAATETHVGDRVVQAGERVVVSLVAANHDPQLVGASSGLDIRRSHVRHVAFGYGEHQCPGQHLARLEMSIAIPAALRRFPGMVLAVPKDALGWRPHASVYGLAELPVRW